MPSIRTDDGPRRLRAVWLGPRGARWPVDWTYVQWAVFAGFSLLLPPMIFGITAVIFGPWMAAGFSLGGFVGAYRLARLLPTYVDYDRPVRYWVHTIKSEYGHSVRINAVQERREGCAAPEVDYLTPGAARAIFPHESRWWRAPFGTRGQQASQAGTGTH